MLINNKAVCNQSHEETMCESGEKKAKYGEK